MTILSERPVAAKQPGAAEPVGPTAPSGAAPEKPEQRRSLATVLPQDVYALVGSGIASLALTTLLFRVLLPLSGVLGFVVVAYVGFLLLYAAVLVQQEDRPAVVDKLAGVVVTSLGLLMLTALVFVIGYTLWRGREALPHGNFYTSDMSNAGPLEPLSVGGIVHALSGTLIQISIALTITVPLGVTCAVFLNEVPGTFARFVRTIAEAMTALPSIVAGLFIYATVVLALGFDKSGFAAALALGVEMLPIIIRASDVVLRLVPGNLREAAYGIGSSQWRTVWSVVLPTARSGLATAVILGTARGIGETSPVLIVAGFTSRLNTDPLHGPMNSLPLATFFFVKSPQPSMIARGFGTGALLMLLVLVLFTIARVLGGRGPGELSSGQQRRRVSASSRDLQRYRLRDESRLALAQPGFLPGFVDGAEPAPADAAMPEPPPDEPPTAEPPTAGSPTAGPPPGEPPAAGPTPDTSLRHDEGHHS